MNDGVIAQDVNVFGGEVRIPVEVWKDGHMLFPTYDESVPGRNLWAIKYKDFTNYTGTVYYAQFDIATGGLKYGKGNPYTFSAKVKRNMEIVAEVYGNVGYVRNDGVTSSDYYRINPTNTGGNTWDYAQQFYLPELQTGLLVDRIRIRLERTSVSMEKNFDFGKFKLEEGDNPNPVWTPAPEELLELATIHPVNSSYRIENNEIVLSNFTENRGYVDIEISYGEGWTRTKRVNFHRKNRIQDIQVKGKRPYRAYLGNNLIWHKYHERTQAIFDYANDRYFQLPTNRIAYDDYIRGLLKNGLLDKLDLHYVFSGDGDTNFKLINVVNPGVYNGTAYGGLEWSAEGVKGNGVNGYVDTNFNPFFGGGAYSHANASINAIISQAYSTNSRITGTRGNSTNSINNENTKSQYINSATPDSSSASIDFRSTGLKSINRTSETTIHGVNKSIITESTQNINIGDFLSQRIFSSYPTGSPNYGDMKISSFSMGASLTYEETQIFRELFNKYLKSNNLQEIA